MTANEALQRIASFVGIKSQTPMYDQVVAEVLKVVNRHHDFERKIGSIATLLGVELMHDPAEFVAGVEPMHQALSRIARLCDTPEWDLPGDVVAAVERVILGQCPTGLEDVQALGESLERVAGDSIQDRLASPDLPTACKSCGGRGWRLTPDQTKCRACNGTGISPGSAAPFDGPESWATSECLHCGITLYTASHSHRADCPIGHPRTTMIGTPSDGWLSTPPEPHTDLLVWSGQDSEYFLLERTTGTSMWTRHDSRGNGFTANGLVEQSRARGWRYQAIVLPDPPESEWDDDDADRINAR